MVSIESLKGKKVAVYLRRSKGEKGTTKDQLTEITPFIKSLQNKKLIKSFDFGVKGRSIDKSYRGVDLDRKGDIYNEGDGFSGFNVDERPVFMALLEEARNGKYDAILAVSMDRYARNYGALSRYAYELFDLSRQPKPVVFYGTAEKIGLGTNEEDEVLISALMGFGGLTKRIEIRKGEKKRKGTAVDRGYLLGARPEWVGKVYRGKTGGVVEYRKAWEAIQAGKGARAVGKAARKFDTTGGGSTSFTRSWKPRLQAYDKLGVLDDWLTNFEAVNDYILNYGEYPKSSFKSKEVSQLLSQTAGYFAYPAGVVLEVENDGVKELQFITFPKPLDIGIDRLATVLADDMDDFIVTRTSEIPEPLNKYQTQPRSGGK